MIHKDTLMNLNTLNEQDIESMPYVQFMAALNETNRPPGGKKALRLLALYSFIDRQSEALHVGCNTGSSTREIVHLAKCNATGIDRSLAMIEMARLNAKRDRYHENLHFVQANVETIAQHYPDGEIFDLVFSTGAIAFVNDRRKAVEQLVRVTKTWGFIADIVMFYREQPTKGVIEAMNREMGIEIEPWDLDFWHGLYADSGLEEYFIHSEKMPQVSQEEINHYSKTIVNGSLLPKETHSVATQRLNNLMSLFNQNHRWLSWALLIYRKRVEPEQETLFGV